MHDVAAGTGGVPVPGTTVPDAGGTAAPAARGGDPRGPLDANLGGSRQGEEGVTSSGERADAAFVAHQLGATPLLDKDGVTAYVWHPAPGTPPLVLPTNNAAAHP